MAEVRDLVPELLIAIRDEMKATRVELSARIEHLENATGERLDRVEGELHASNERLDRVEVGLRETRDELRVLGRRQVEAELRFGTAITELQGATRELIGETKKLHERIDHVLLGPMGETLRDVTREQSECRARVVRCEERLDALEHDERAG